MVHVDLTSPQESEHVDGWRIRGRFWVLADESDDEDKEGAAAFLPVNVAPVKLESRVVASVAEGESPVTAMDTIDDRSAPSSEIGSVELVHRTVHRRSVATAIRPWKGPMPKVCIKPITLLDFILRDSWTQVTRKKKRKVWPVAALPAPVTRTADEIRAARALRLN